MAEYKLEDMVYREPALVVTTKLFCLKVDGTRCPLIDGEYVQFQFSNHLDNYFAG